MSLSGIESFKLLFIDYKPSDETSEQLDDAVNALKDELDRGKSALETIRGYQAYGQSGGASGETLADIRKKVDELRLAWPQLEGRWAKLNEEPALAAIGKVRDAIAGLGERIKAVDFVPADNGPVTSKDDEGGLRNMVVFDIGELKKQAEQAEQRVRVTAEIDRMKADRGLAAGAQGKSDASESAKAKFDASAAAFDRLVSAGNYVKAANLLPQLKGDLAKLLSAEKGNSEKKAAFESRLPDIERARNELSSRCTTATVWKEGFAPRYEAAYKPLADIGYAWVGESAISNFVSALDLLDKGAGLLGTVTEAFDKLDKEWEELGEEGQARADSAQTDAKAQYEPVEVGPAIEELNARLAAAAEACSSGKYPAGRDATYKSAAARALAMSGDAEKYASVKDFASAVRAANAFKDEFTKAKEKLEALDAQYAAAESEYKLLEGRIALLMKRRDDAVRDKVPALAWPYQAELRPLQPAHETLKDLTAKGDFLSGLAKAKDLQETIEEIEGNFDDYDGMQSALTTEATELEVKDFDKRKSEYEGKDDQVWSQYQKVSDRLKLAEAKVSPEYYKTYDEAFSPARNQWLEQRAIADTGDYKGAIEAAEASLERLKTAYGIFDKLDAEWPDAKEKAKEAEARAKQVIEDVMDMPRKQLRQLGGAEQVKMLKALVAYDKTKGSPSRKAQYTLLKSMKLDPAFDEKYTAVCNDVADKIAEDSIVKDAKKNWADWSKDEQSREENLPKVKALMERILQIQSGELARLLKVGDEEVEFKPPELEFFESRETLSGEFDPRSKKIKLNKKGKSIWDLKSLIDTVTHENTHNYQDKMMMKLDVIPEGHEFKLQISMFAANDKGGYVSSTEADEEKDYEAYRKQPQERHAFKAGGEIAQRAYSKL